MARQGRKNVHGKAGVRFKAAYTASKNYSMLRNVVSELIVHDEVTVTSGVAPELVSLADSMVTLAKENTLASRRHAASVLRDGIKDKNGVSALDKLFKELGPKMKDRVGGYTKTYKLGARKGDNAELVLVRWSD